MCSECLPWSYVRNRRILLLKMVRLEKYLSDCGIGSRKEIKELIKCGRAKQIGETVFLDGKELKYTQFRYFAMNKPAGYVCANEDAKSPTVFSLLSSPLERLGLFTVGRLDKDTTGLLILTNDGDFAHRVISPKSGINKLYYAVTDGAVNQNDIDRFREGIGTFLPAVLEKIDDRSCLVTVQEGKYHQVKRMLESVGKPVIRLKRLKIGNYSLPETLNEGEVVELSQKNLEEILAQNG